MWKGSRNKNRAVILHNGISLEKIQISDPYDLILGAFLESTKLKKIG